MTAETLSGIPSIVYGLFGMLFFSSTLHWGYSMLSGAFTMAIMILPLIMRTSEEAFDGCSGFLPGGQLRCWSRKAQNDLQNRSSQCRSGNFVRVILGIGALSVKQRL